MAQVFGNTSGLKASALRKAERVFRRRVDPSLVVSPELATFLCQLSREIGRQMGLLINRRGQPEHVIIGDTNRLWLPDIGRLRGGQGRLRGLRLIHTHLRGEQLSNDDLTDLVLLHLDLVTAITMTADGFPALVHAAHVLPENAGGQLWRVLEPFSVYEVQFNFLELVKSLEEEFAQAPRARIADSGADCALLVILKTRESKRASDACVSELRELCRTASVTVLDTVVQRRDRSDPKYAVGRGKLDEILLKANQRGAELLIFDPDLTPAQARAISDITDLKVIDRTMLILDIFAQRAKSRDGKLQVELAQLKYTLPRLIERNTMMSRLTGGIGGRGPGETKLEINRRRARERITRLEKQIKDIAQQRTRRRDLRKRRGLPIVSIVGYTNAGKTTLLNALTESKALVENKLFATLDPLSRRLRFPRERELILTDTVGFIHELPVELVNAFRATLEELSEADLLLHLVDCSDPVWEDHVRAVRGILHELGLAKTPTILVFNKTDLLSPDELNLRLQGFNALSICALNRESTRALLAAVEDTLWREDRLPEKDFTSSTLGD
ncbi:MAG: GTPase HflX [Pseudomonadota bacterium]